MTLADLRAGRLVGATSLRLRGLDAFPREILDLADTLEVLDLSDNAIAALPDDLGRLRRLRVLFCSNTRFERLPPVLGDCPALSQVGFRGAGLREVPAEALPSGLRWLTLTGNRIEALPDELGRRPSLQKLMLSGNRLRALPDSLEGAAALELLRLSANRLEALPGWIGTLPALAWLAWSGNPLGPPPPDRAAGPAGVDWSELRLGPLLGEGASGRVHRADWGGRAVAVKLFRDAMTSDGLPEHEIAACLAAGTHPHLLGGLGVAHGHPGRVPALLLTLLPDGWGPLAGPPSLESCSRDVYAPGLRLGDAALLRLAAGMAAAAAHLHARGLLHGDLYAHNVLWDGRDGKAVLSDFGGASFLQPDAGVEPAALRRIETRAWGLLLGELLERRAAAADRAALRALQRDCVQPVVGARPEMAEIVAALAGFLP